MNSNSNPTVPSADDFLMGESVPSAKFPEIGATVSGTICEPPVVQQQRDYTTGELKFWSDGNPMMQLVVTLQTDERDPGIVDDDGRRRVYVRGQLKRAVQRAVKTAGAPGLAVGGQLTVTYARDGQPTNPRFNPPKEYTAVYNPPSGATEPTTSPTASAAPAQQAAQVDPNSPEIQALLAQIQGQQPPAA